MDTRTVDDRDMTRRSTTRSGRVVKTPARYEPEPVKFTDDYSDSGTSVTETDSSEESSDESESDNSFVVSDNEVEYEDDTDREV